MTSKEKSIKVSTILEIIAKLRKKYSNFEKVYKPSLIGEDIINILLVAMMFLLVWRTDINNM